MIESAHGQSQRRYHLCDRLAVAVTMGGCAMPEWYGRLAKRVCSTAHGSGDRHTLVAWPT